ncbi:MULTISPECIES: hypothetical protein [Bacteria]|uniref:hypothetical protein n=1 Tax=Bacteria TaxID=2 RepID=UPI003C7A2E82
MTEYTARLPSALSEEDIEDLRGIGAVELTFVGDFRNRDEAVRALGDEYGWRGLDRSWWDVHLSGRRARNS